MATFESMDRRMPKIEACLKANGLESLDACNEMLLAKGIDCDKIVRGVQPICFDNAVWAYTLGTAIAVKRGLTDAAECAAAIGEGLEAFTIPGSVAEQSPFQIPAEKRLAALRQAGRFSFPQAGEKSFPEPPSQRPAGRIAAAVILLPAHCVHLPPGSCRRRSHRWAPAPSPRAE